MSGQGSMEWVVKVEWNTQEELVEGKYEWSSIGKQLVGKGLVYSL